MYSVNGEDIFVVDGHMHFWDAGPDNHRNEYGNAWIKCFYDYHSALSPAEHVWSFEKYCNYGEEALINDQFIEGYVDVAVLNSTYLYEFFKTGFNTHQKNNTIKQKHPDRFVLCGSFDPREEEAGRLMRRAVEAFGGLDLLVANAGTTAHGPVEGSDPEKWWRVLEVNLLGAYLCARAAIPHLKARGSGKIITIGSGMGQRAYAEASAYGCSKAGLSMLTRVLAAELWEHDISVNELIPGPVITAMNPVGPGSPSRFGEIEWNKKPEDVVPLALFLATQPARGPTGQKYSLTRRDL